MFGNAFKKYNVRTGSSHQSGQINTVSAKQNDSSVTAQPSRPMLLASQSTKSLVSEDSAKSASDTNSNTPSATTSSPKQSKSHWFPNLNKLFTARPSSNTQNISQPNPKNTSKYSELQSSLNTDMGKKELLVAMRHQAKTSKTNVLEQLKKDMPRTPHMTFQKNDDMGGAKIYDLTKTVGQDQSQTNIFLDEHYGNFSDSQKEWVAIMSSQTATNALMGHLQEKDIGFSVFGGTQERSVTIEQQPNGNIHVTSTFNQNQRDSESRKFMASLSEEMGGINALEAYNVSFTAIIPASGEPIMEETKVDIPPQKKVE